MKLGSPAPKVLPPSRPSELATAAPKSGASPRPKPSPFSTDTFKPTGTPGASISPAEVKKYGPLINRVAKTLAGNAALTHPREIRDAARREFQKLGVKEGPVLDALVERTVARFGAIRNGSGDRWMRPVFIP